MNKTSKEDFELIAQDAVSALIAAAMTLKLMGETELALAINESARKCIERAIALGGV